MSSDDLHQSFLLCPARFCILNACRDNREKAFGILADILEPASEFLKQRQVARFTEAAACLAVKQDFADIGIILESLLKSGFPLITIAVGAESVFVVRRLSDFRRIGVKRILAVRVIFIAQQIKRQAQAVSAVVMADDISGFVCLIKRFNALFFIHGDHFLSVMLYSSLSCRIFRPTAEMTGTVTLFPAIL